VLELVAGPGEYYAAMAAPALGTEAGVKFDLPTPAPAPKVTAPTPPPRVETVSPIMPAPSPPVVKPAPKTPPKQKQPDPAKDIAAQLKKKVAAAKKKVQVQAAKDRKKEQARMTKEQFDREQAAKKVASAKTAKTSSAKTSPAKFKPIDTKGISGGVVGGSSASTKGAGGKALTRAEATLLELYDAEFLQKLRRAFEEDRPPGLSDALRVTIGVRSNADGSLTSARVTQPSGTPEFDKAVLDALRRVKMPPRPDRKAETVSFVFTMREG
jgi:TonB family protein